MSIYTRQGDDGRADRGGERTAKSDPFFEAIGTVDELNAQIGLCRAAVEPLGPESPIGTALGAAQGELLTVGALLAVGAGMVSGGRDAEARLEAAAEGIEQRIDDGEERLRAMTSFVLPGGCEASARLHVARTVCRRAERRVVAARQAGAAVPEPVLRYLNRLGDLLFTLAREANAAAGAAEQEWRA